jgi:glycosyltransferase involved in cell wall biosynthesis
MNENTGLTVFIPVFNEAEILESNLRKLDDFLGDIKIPYEIIVGSNGSYDKTLEILGSLQTAFPSLSHFHIPHKAVGQAFRKGLEKARFNRFICLDMDLSIDLSFVERAYALLSTVHIVVGSKITGDQRRSFLRKTASNAFIFCARNLLGLSFTDYSIAAKAYRKDAVSPFLQGLDDQTFYVTEILFRAHHKGLSITEIPVDCHDTRKSRFNLAHEGWYKFSRLFGLFTMEMVLNRFCCKSFSNENRSIPGKADRKPVIRD